MTKSQSHAGVRTSFNSARKLAGERGDERCVIDNTPHIIIHSKCILCDKQWCCCYDTHGLAKYVVRSGNGSTTDAICDFELNRYLERGWIIEKVLR